MSIEKRLKGSIPALVTPMLSNGDIDKVAYKKIIRRALGAGCSGVMILGSAGEGPVTSTKQFADAVEIAVDEVNGEFPVIVGTGSGTVEGVENNIKVAYKMGANAVLNVPPFYYPLSQKSMEDFFRKLAQDSPIPVMIYNIPALTKNNVGLETVINLSKEENIVGIKDSSGDFVYFQKMISKAQSPNFKIFQGRAPYILASLLLGADGSMGPVPNIAPEVELAIHKHVKAGEIKEARKYQEKIFELVKMFGYEGNPISMNLKGLMKNLGLCEKYTAEGISLLSEEQSKIFGENFRKIIAEKI